jgi:2-polyprenyl-3-methyl-5-hydroxy-6-metoxy-1,4-benzoquinol methylase
MIKNLVLKLVREKPHLRKVLSVVYINFLKIRFHKKIKFNKITYINPLDVNYYSKNFNIYNSQGRILDGNWDRNRKKLEDYTTFKGLKERFVYGNNWENTIYFKENIKKINNGKVLWNCQNKKDLIKRCRNLDKLFDNIKKQGFYVESEKSKDILRRDYDFVTINIDRNGEILFNDGAHRLCIAKILKLKEIPVRVLVRHKNWFNYIKKIDSLLLNKTSYQSLNHPDLNNIFTIIHKCEDRFEIIKKNVKDIKKGKVLDIGANMGFFSQKLEEIGFIPYLIEHEKNFVKFLETTKNVRKFKYKVISEDMFIWMNKNNQKFKITLVLSIFHHYLKTKNLFEKLKSFLNKLDTEVLILETHDTKEKQMINVYKNFNGKEFVSFIKKETNLKTSKKIGKINGREIYIFKK